MHLKLQNANDRASQQIAITGFHTGWAEQRILAVTAFIAADCGPEVHCTVMNEEKGHRNKSELTDTALVTFLDTGARDKALKVIETTCQK